MRAITRQIALLYSFHLILGCHFFSEVGSFFCVCVFVYCFCYGTYSRVLVEHYETSSNNFDLKNRCIFHMCFTGNGFKTVYYFCKELNLRSCGVPRYACGLSRLCLWLNAYKKVSITLKEINKKKTISKFSKIQSMAYCSSSQCLLNNYLVIST